MSSEVVMMTGPPVSWDGVPQEFVDKLLEVGYMEGKPMYSDSIELVCQHCERVFFLGPRQAAAASEMEAKGHDVRYFCFVCMAFHIAADSGETRIISLQSKPDNHWSN